MTLIDELADAIDDIIDSRDAAEVALKIVRDHDLKQLEEMRLHDNTGDMRDVGYMEAVNEVHDWLVPPGTAST